MSTMTHEEWTAEAVRRFGVDPMKWAFTCPSCNHVATVADWKAAGAGEGEVAFSCVGRHIEGGDAKTFKRKGGPCNYAGGGLFKLNPVTVTMGDGTEHSVFAFADAPVDGEEPK